jgi:hypothetical protein
MKRVKLIGSCLLFLFFPHLFLSGQEKSDVYLDENRYSIENITVSDGHNSDVIRDVLQLSFGFLWMAGSRGIQ